MQLKFLHEKEDVGPFVDFLYDHTYCLAYSNGVRKGELLERQAAKESLYSDLVSTMRGGNYWIVATIQESPSIVLDMTSCGRWSHPRCTNRMLRYPGIVSHCYGKEKTVVGEELIKSIRKFFKENCAFKHCQKAGRECCFFATHYQILDEAYAQNPEPTWLCPGYIRMVCAPEYLDTVTQRMEEVIAHYPALQHGAPVPKHARDRKTHMEVYMSLLCDRREFDLQEFTKIVDNLGYAKGRAIGRKENLYIEADTSYRDRKDLNVKWNVYGLIENEWKGFGNFNT